MNRETLELLGAYLLQTTDEAEEKLLLERLGSFEDDPQASSSLREMCRVMNALPHALDLKQPPRELKERILAKAASEKPVAASETGASEPPQLERPFGPGVQVWKKWSQPRPQDFVVQRRSEGSWEDTGMPGVEVKRLFVDEARNYVTMVVRMQPGTAYPQHRHAGFEECYVLEGDLNVGDTVLQAGDYQRMEGGTVHGVQSTVNGCLLFIVSSQEDELVA